MREGAKKLPGYQSGEYKNLKDVSRMSTANDQQEAHLVGWKEELREEAEARREEARIQEQNAEIFRQIEAGEYKLPDASVVIGSEKANLNDAVKRARENPDSDKDKRALRRAIEMFSGHIVKVKEAWKNWIETPEEDELDGMELDEGRAKIFIKQYDTYLSDLDDPEAEENIGKKELVINSVGVGVKEHGEPDSAAKRLDVVTVNDIDYHIPPENHIGTGGFGEVSEGDVLLEVGDELSNGRIMNSVGITAKDLDSTVIKVIRYPEEANQEESNRVRDAALAREMVGNEMAGQLVGVTKYRDGKGREAAVIALEKAEGKDMKKVMMEHRKFLRSPEGRLVTGRAMLSVIDDLMPIHDAGFAHKDIKPANIIVDFQNGTARLVDHGLVKSVAESRIEGDSEKTEGTQAYQDPEAWDPGVDRRSSDIYALGLSFAEMFQDYMQHYGNVDNAGESDADAESNGDQKLGIFALLAKQMAGEYVESDNLDDDTEREKFFATLETQPERDLAQLLYDMVRPHDSVADRKNAWAESEVTDLGVVRARLEKILENMEVIVKARILSKNILEGNGPASLTADDVAILEEAIESNDVRTIEAMTSGVNKLYSENSTPRVEQLKLLDEKLASLKTKFYKFTENNEDAIKSLGLDDEIDNANVLFMAYGFAMDESHAQKALELNKEIESLYGMIRSRVTQQKERSDVYRKSVDTYEDELNELLKGVDTSKEVLSVERMIGEIRSAFKEVRLFEAAGDIDSSNKKKEEIEEAMRDVALRIGRPMKKVFRKAEDGEYKTMREGEFEDADQPAA